MKYLDFKEGELVIVDNTWGDLYDSSLSTGIIDLDIDGKMVCLLKTVETKNKVSNERMHKILYFNKTYWLVDNSPYNSFERQRNIKKIIK